MKLRRKHRIGRYPPSFGIPASRPGKLASDRGFRRGCGFAVAAGAAPAWATC